MSETKKNESEVSDTKKNEPQNKSVCLITSLGSYQSTDARPCTTLGNGMGGLRAPFLDPIVVGSYN